VNNLNQLYEICEVQVKASSFNDLKQPFQVVYNGNTEFYNNHNKDNKLLPIYLYTQSTEQEIKSSSNDNTGIIVYASTAELNFFSSPDLNAINSLGDSGQAVCITPAWSQLKSRKPILFGIHSEVFVRCLYDEKSNIITFYFPIIYTSALPSNPPKLLSTYTEYETY
jgi:hypothetical protein